MNPVEAPAQNLAYSDVVRGPEVSDKPVAYVPDPQNELPDRPLTVFFNPCTRIPAHEVFQALQSSGLNNSVSCIQRQSSGEIVLTFRNARTKEQFLSHNVVIIRDTPFALQDIDLQVFDAPHEMPDATIIQRLAKYCDVLHHRRGYFREPGWEHVQDGVRHYRVRVKENIPNFIRFGKIFIHFRYEGQPRTCRHCNQTGHYVNACHSIICYNCVSIGHVASDCPTEVLCNICKQSGHCAKTCPFSWSRQVEENPSAANGSEIPAETPEPVNPEADPTIADPPDPASADQPSSVDEELSPEDMSGFTTRPETMELFQATQPSTDPPPKPQCGRSVTRRQPAHVSPTIIPSRTPTHPVLVTGKSRDDLPENIDTEMDPELAANKLKCRSPETPWSNKHKKHR